MEVMEVVHMEHVQLTMEIIWACNMISLSCGVYIGSMVLKLICKAVHYINLLDKNEKQ